MRLSLNLLSPKKKEVLKTEFALVYIQTILFVLLLVVVFVSATLFTLKLVMKSAHEGLTEQTAVSSGEYSQVADQIREINGYLKHVDELQQEFIDWQAIMETITTAVPRGTQLHSITIDTGRTVRISGIARERDDVLAMQESLDNLPFFSEVTAPLSNILQKKDVMFEFQMHFDPHTEE